MSFGFLLAAFLATTNAGRVALAAQRHRPGMRSRVAAPLLGAAVVVAGVVFADAVLDGLAISPESWRIATGLVLAATGVRTIIWPAASAVPFAGVLVTPELTTLAFSFGADEPAGKVLAAAAVSLVVVLLSSRARRPGTSALAAQFLAALQLVVAVALGVSGIRDV